MPTTSSDGTVPTHRGIIAGFSSWWESCADELRGPDLVALLIAGSGGAVGNNNNAGGGGDECVVVQHRRVEAQHSSTTSGPTTPTSRRSDDGDTDASQQHRVGLEAAAAERKSVEYAALGTIADLIQEGLQRAQVFEQTRKEKLMKGVDAVATEQAIMDTLLETLYVIPQDLQRAVLQFDAAVNVDEALSGEPVMAVAGVDPVAGALARRQSSMRKIASGSGGWSGDGDPRQVILERIGSGEIPSRRPQLVRYLSNSLSGEGNNKPSTSKPPHAAIPVRHHEDDRPTPAGGSKSKSQVFNAALSGSGTFNSNTLDRATGSSAQFNFFSDKTEESLPALEGVGFAATVASLGASQQSASELITGVSCGSILLNQSGKGGGVGTSGSWNTDTGANLVDQNTNINKLRTTSGKVTSFQLQDETGNIKEEVFITIEERARREELEQQRQFRRRQEEAKRVIASVSGPLTAKPGPFSHRSQLPPQASRREYDYRSYRSPATIKEQRRINTLVGVARVLEGGGGSKGTSTVLAALVPGSGSGATVAAIGQHRRRQRARANRARALGVAGRAEGEEGDDDNVFGYVAPTSHADAAKKRAIEVSADYVTSNFSSVGQIARGDGYTSSISSTRPPEVLFDLLRDIKKSFDFFPSFISHPVLIGAEDHLAAPGGGAHGGKRSCPWEATSVSTTHHNTPGHQSESVPHSKTALHGTRTALGDTSAGNNVTTAHAANTTTTRNTRVVDTRPVFTLKSSVEGAASRLVAGGFPEDLFRVFIAPVFTLSLDDSVNARLSAQMDVEASGSIGWDSISTYLLNTAQAGGGIRVDVSAGLRGGPAADRFSFATPKEFLLSDKQRSERGKMGGDSKDGAWSGQVQAILRRLKLASLIRGGGGGSGGGGDAMSKAIAGRSVDAPSHRADDGGSSHSTEGEAVSSTGVCRHNSEVTKVLFSKELQGDPTSSSVNPGVDRFVFTSGLDGAVHMWDATTMAHQSIVQAPYFSHSSVFYEETSSSGAGGAKGGTVAAKGAGGLSLQSTGGESNAARFRFRVNDMSFSSAGHLLVAQSKGKVMSYIVNPQSKPVLHRTLRVMFGRVSGFANMTLEKRPKKASGAALARLRGKASPRHHSGGDSTNSSDSEDHRRSHHRGGMTFDEDDEDFVQLAGDKTSDSDVFLLSPFPGDVSSICGLKASVAGVEVGAGATTAEDKVAHMIKSAETNMKARRQHQQDASTNGSPKSQKGRVSINLGATTTTTTTNSGQQSRITPDALKRAGAESTVADFGAAAGTTTSGTTSVVTSGSARLRLSPKQCSATDYYRYLTSGFFFKNSRRMTLRSDPDPANPPLTLNVDPAQQPHVLNHHTEPILVGLDTGVIHLYNIHQHPSFTNSGSAATSNSGGALFGSYAPASITRGYYEPLHTFASNCFFKKGRILSLIDDSPYNHQFLALGGVGEVSTAAFATTASYLAHFQKQTREGVFSDIRMGDNAAAKGIGGGGAGPSGYYSQQRRLMSGMHSVVQFVDYETMNDTNTLRLIPHSSSSSDASAVYPCTGIAYDNSMGIVLGYGHFRAATVFSAAFGNVIATLDSHAAPVIGAAINATKGELIIGTEDRVIHTYDVRTYQKLSSALYRHPSDEYLPKGSSGGAASLGRCVGAGISSKSGACVMSPFTTLGYDVLRQRPVASTNVPVALVEKKPDGEALSAFVEDQAAKKTTTAPDQATTTTATSAALVSIVGKANKEKAAAKALQAGLTPSGYGTEMHTVTFNPHFGELAMAEGRRVVIRPQGPLLLREVVGGWRHLETDLSKSKNHQVEWRLKTIPPFAAVAKTFHCRGTVTKVRFDLHGRRVAVASAGCHVDVIASTTGTTLMSFVVAPSAPVATSNPSLRKSPTASSRLTTAAQSNNEVLCVEFANLADGTSVLAAGTFSGLLSLHVHNRGDKAAGGGRAGGAGGAKGLSARGGGSSGSSASGGGDADGVAGTIEVFRDQHSSSIVSLAAVGKGASKLFVGTAAGFVYEYDLEYFRRTLVASFDLLHGGMGQVAPKALLGTKGSSAGNPHGMGGRKGSYSFLLDGSTNGGESSDGRSPTPNSLSPSPVPIHDQQQHRTSSTPGSSILSSSNIRRKNRNLKRSAKAKQREERRKRGSMSASGLVDDHSHEDPDDSHKFDDEDGDEDGGQKSPDGFDCSTASIDTTRVVHHVLVALPVASKSASGGGNPNSQDEVSNPRPTATRRVSFMVDPSGSPVALRGGGGGGSVPPSGLVSPTISSIARRSHTTTTTSDQDESIRNNALLVVSKRRSNTRYLVEASRTRNAGDADDVDESDTVLSISQKRHSSNLVPHPPPKAHDPISNNNNKLSSLLNGTNSNDRLQSFRAACHNEMDRAVELMCTLDESHVVSVHGTGQVMVYKVGQSETLKLFSFQAISHNTSASAVSFHAPTSLLVIGDFTGTVSFFDLSPFFAKVNSADGTLKQVPLFYGSLEGVRSAGGPPRAFGQFDSVGQVGRDAVYEYVHFLGVLPLLPDALVSDLCFTEEEQEVLYKNNTYPSSGNDQSSGALGHGGASKSAPTGKSYGTDDRPLSDMVVAVHQSKALANTILGNATTTTDTTDTISPLNEDDDNTAVSNPLRGTWPSSCTISSRSTSSTVVDLRRRDHLYKALQAVLQSSSAEVPPSVGTADGLVVSAFTGSSIPVASPSHRTSITPPHLNPTLQRRRDTQAHSLAFTSPPHATAKRSFSLIVSFSEAMLAIVISLPTAMISNVLVQPHRMGDPLLRDVLLAAASYRLGYSHVALQREVDSLSKNSNTNNKNPHPSPSSIIVGGEGVGSNIKGNQHQYQTSGVDADGNLTTNPSTTPQSLLLGKLLHHPIHPTMNNNKDSVDAIHNGEVDNSPVWEDLGLEANIERCFKLAIGQQYQRTKAARRKARKVAKRLVRSDDTTTSKQQDGGATEGLDEACGGGTAVTTHKNRRNGGSAKTDDSSSEDSSSSADEGADAGTVPDGKLLEVSTLKSEALRLVERGCSWFVPAVPPQLLSTVMRPRSTGASSQPSGAASQHPEGQFELYSRVPIPGSRKEPTPSSSLSLPTASQKGSVLGERYLPVLAPAVASRRERRYYRFRHSLESHPFFLHWQLSPPGRQAVANAMSTKQLPRPTPGCSTSGGVDDPLVTLALEHPHLAQITMSTDAFVLDERLVFRPLREMTGSKASSSPAPSAASPPVAAAALSLFGGGLVDMTEVSPTPATTTVNNYHRFDEIRVLSSHPPTLKVRLPRMGGVAVVGGGASDAAISSMFASTTLPHSTTTTSPSSTLIAKTQQPTSRSVSELQSVLLKRLASMLGKCLLRHAWLHSKLLPPRVMLPPSHHSRLASSGSSSSLSDTSTSSSSSADDEEDDGDTVFCGGASTSSRRRASLRTKRRHAPSAPIRRMYLSPGSSIFGSGRHWSEEAALLCTLQERLAVEAEKRRVEEAKQLKKRLEAEEKERQSRWPKGPAAARVSIVVSASTASSSAPGTAAEQSSQVSPTRGVSFTGQQRQDRRRRASNALRNSLFKVPGSSGSAATATQTKNKMSAPAANEVPVEETPVERVPSFAFTAHDSFIRAPGSDAPPLMMSRTNSSVAPDTSMGDALLGGDASANAECSATDGETLVIVDDNKTPIVPFNPELAAFESYFETPHEEDHEAAVATSTALRGRRRSSVRVGGQVEIGGGGMPERHKGAKLIDTGVTSVPTTSATDGRPPRDDSGVSHPASVLLGRTYHGEQRPTPRPPSASTPTPGAPVPHQADLTKYVTEFGYSDHRRVEIVRNKAGGGSNATTSGADFEYKCVLVEDDNTEVEEVAYIDSIFSRSFHENDFDEGGDQNDQQVTSVDGLHEHVVRRSRALGDGTRPSPSHLAILAKRRQQIYNKIGSGGKAMSSTERQLHKILTSGEAGSTAPTEQPHRGSSSPARGGSPRRPLSRRNSSAAEIFADLARRESDGATLSGNGSVSQVFAAEERRSAAALGRNKHRIVHEGLTSTIKMLEGGGRKSTTSPRHFNGDASDGKDAVSESSARKQQQGLGGLVARLYPAPPPYRSSPRAQVEQAKDGQAARLYVNQSGGPSPSGSPTRSSSSAGTRAVEGGKKPLIDYSPRRPASSFSSSDFTSAPPPPLRPGEGRGQNLIATGSEAGATMTTSERLMLQGGIRRDVAYVTRGVWLAQPPQFHSIVMPPSDPVFPERTSKLVPTINSSRPSSSSSNGANRHQTESLWKSAISEITESSKDASPSSNLSQQQQSDTSNTLKEEVFLRGMDSVDYALSKAASLHSRVQLVKDEKQRKLELNRKGESAAAAASSPRSPRGGGANTTSAVRPPTAPMAVRLNRVFSSVEPSPLQFTTSPRGTHRATSARGPRGTVDVDPLDRYVVSPRRTSTHAIPTTAPPLKKGAKKI